MDAEEEPSNESDSLEILKKEYDNQSHSEAKMQLIRRISENYPNKGDSFLIEKYKKESDWKVRKTLIKAVAEGNIKESVAFFIEALGDSHLESKKTAVELLGKARAPEALSPLFDLLQYGKVDYYNELIEAIVKISRDLEITTITSFLESGNIYIKRAIPVILGRIGNKNAEAALKSLLSDPNPEIRRNSVKALEKLIDKPDEINIILQTLEDENEEVRRESIKLLGKLGNERAIHPLIDLLKDESPMIRRTVVKSLYKLLKEASNFRILYNIIKKRNPHARREAVKLLGMIGDASTRTLNLLIRTLNSKDGYLRRRAYGSLIKIYETNEKQEHQTDILSRILESLKAREPQIRKYSAKILGEIGNDRVIESLFTLLDDSKSGVRRAATNALANFGSEKVITIATQFLNDEDWRMRRSIVKLLIRISKETNLKNEALEPLMGCVNDEDKYVKSWAVKALGNLTSIDNIEIFVSLLEHEDSAIKIATIKALGKIGATEAIKPLSNVLADDDWNVRKEAENALKKIDEDWMKFL